MEKNKPANRVFEEYMRSLEPEKEKNNKLSVAGAEDLEQENAATTEELSDLIKMMGSETTNTEITTDIEEENIQTTLQEEKNEEYIKKANEERFLAEQEAKKRIEEEARAAEEAKETEKKKKKRFPLLFKRKKKEEETPIDIEMAPTDERKDVTPKQADENGVPVLKKDKNLFAKAFAKPTKITKGEIPEIKSAEESINESEQDWQFIATHDEATGFYNKKAFDLRGGESFPALGVIVMDINNLKYINERFGREEGDALILRMTERLKTAFSGNEIYRIDGDEFVILLLDQEKGRLPVIVDSRIEQLMFDFSRMTEKGNGIIYSATFGSCIAEEKETVRSAAKKATAKMLEEKKEYHENHPEFSLDDERIPERTEEEKKDTVISQEEYDEALSIDQRRLKESVASYHEVVSVPKVERIMEDINEKILTEGSHIKAIIMSSEDFNNVFVFQNPQTFLGMVESVNNSIDFSYLYVITREGTQYYGPDRYSDEVDEVFKSIGNAIRSGTVRTKEELSEIPAMGIFQFHYSDFRD